MVDVRVKHQHEIGSDHLFVNIRINVTNKREDETEMLEKIEFLSIRSYKLNDVECQQKYQTQIERGNEAKKWGLRSWDIEVMWEPLKV